MFGIERTLNTVVTDTWRKRDEFQRFHAGLLNSFDGHISQNCRLKVKIRGRRASGPLSALVIFVTHRQQRNSRSAYNFLHPAASLSFAFTSADVNF